MDTTTSTPTATPGTPAGSGSRGRTVFVTAVAAIVGAGVAAGLVIGFAGPITGTPTSSVTVVEHAPPAAGSGHHVTPAHPVTPPAPPAPSVAVMTLQRELGQLNYYEGPITGTMTTQTVQSIKYLQRDANLPQTGVLNPATQQAMANFLANGNNQMGS